jgi:hypothetical protein
MSERRTSMIERVLHRIEDHVEEWRRQDAACKAEVASQREELWAAPQFPRIPALGSSWIGVS